MEKYSDFDLDDPGLVSMLDDMPAWSAPFGLRLLETVVCRRGMTVLDLGTGTGFPLTVLAARLGGGCRAIGIDPWRRAALRCRDRIRKTGLDTAAVVLGRARRCPFPIDVSIA